LNLEAQLEKLFAIIRDDYRPKYNEIVRIARGNRAMITDGEECVLISTKGRRLNVSSAASVREAPVGRFSREGVLGLVDGQLTLDQALEMGLIDCAGSVSEVLRFFKILRIVVFVSSRSLRAYNLWNEYKQGSHTHEDLGGSRRDPDWYCADHDWAPSDSPPPGNLLFSGQMPELVTESSPSRPLSVLATSDATWLASATLVLEVCHGRRDHYYVAERLARRPCDAMFLMQRSSSLLLGPELGWVAEKKFYDVIRRRIAEGVKFYHVVSVEGIRSHLGRRESSFPQKKEALARLTRVVHKGREVVAVQNKGGLWHIKQIPENSLDEDLKSDRQARTFLIHGTDGSTEGVVVVDVGGMQISFRMRGPEMNAFYQTCLRFYRDKCIPVPWEVISNLLRESAKRNREPAVRHAGQRTRQRVNP
jgi:hypothetical protein